MAIERNIIFSSLLFYQRIIIQLNKMFLVLFRSIVMFTFNTQQIFMIYDAHKCAFCRCNNVFVLRTFMNVDLFFIVSEKILFIFLFQYLFPYRRIFLLQCNIYIKIDRKNSFCYDIHEGKYLVAVFDVREWLFIISHYQLLGVSNTSFASLIIH